LKISGLKEAIYLKGIAICFLIFTVNNLWSKENVQVLWDTGAVSMQHSIQYLNADNGLLQNGVKDLFYHRKSGVLWLATQQGLVRYSGRSVDVLTSGNSPYLNSSRVRDFYLNPDSNLIVYDDENKYCEIDESGLRLKEAKYISEQYLFCTNGTLINRELISNKFRFYFLKTSESEAYTILDFTDHHEFTFFTRDVGYRISNDIGYYFAKHSFAYRGNAYGFTETGHFISLDKTRIDTLAHIPEFGDQGGGKSEVQVVYKDFYGTAYIIYQGKLMEFSLTDDGSPTFTMLASGLPAYEYTSCQIAYEHKRIFLGTRRRGLLELSPRYVQQVFNDDYCGRPYSNYAIAEIGEDSVITADGFIFGTWGMDCSHRFNQSEYWYPIMVDREENRLFTARSRYHLGHFDLETFSYTRDTMDLMGGRYIGPMTSNKGNFYGFIEQYGLCIYENESWNLLNPVSKEISRPRQMIFQNDSLVWLAERWGAVGINLLTGDLTRLKVPKGIVSGRAISIIRDRVWFSMYGAGLWVQEPDTCLQFLPPEYPELEAIHAIIQKGDEVYFSTNNGFLAFNIDDILSYLKGEIKLIQAYSLSKTDGLEQSEFNGGCQPAHLWMSDGKLALPGLLGLTFIDSSFRSFRPALRSNILVKSSSFNGKDTLIENDFELPAYFESFSLQLIHPYYGLSSNARVYYRIPEIGGTWQLVDFKEGIRLNRLPSNQTYSLEVLIPALDANQRQQTILSFKVAPRFIERPIFFLLITLIVLVLFVVVLSIVQKRNKRQKERLSQIIAEQTSDLAKKNVSLLNAIDDLEQSRKDLEVSVEMRNKMITVFSHDIRGPLRFLADIAVNLSSRPKTDTINSVHQELEILASGASGAYSTANNVLEWVRGSLPGQSKVEISLVDAVKRISEQKEAIFKKHDVELVLDLQKDYVTVSSQKVFDIIVENLLQNALKYCQSKIVISIEECENDGLCLRVLDDGFGIMNSKLLKDLNRGNFVTSVKGKRGEIGAGLGLAMVHELIKQIGNAGLSFKNVKGGFLAEVSFAQEASQ